MMAVVLCIALQANSSIFQLNITNLGLDESYISLKYSEYEIIKIWINTFMFSFFCDGKRRSFSVW